MNGIQQRQGRGQGQQVPAVITDHRFEGGEYYIFNRDRSLGMNRTKADGQANPMVRMTFAYAVTLRVTEWFLELPTDGTTPKLNSNTYVVDAGPGSVPALRTGGVRITIEQTSPLTKIVIPVGQGHGYR